MRKIFLSATIVAATACGMAMPATAAPAGVKIGTLTCNVASGWGFVFGSSKEIRCNYSPNKRHGEHYEGSIDKFGVDIGYTDGGVMIWAVIAPTSDIKAGALEGSYAGVTAGASVGVGASANALIGGFDKSITLQPVSIEGNTGLNVAAGIGAMHLKYVP